MITTDPKLPNPGIKLNNCVHVVTNGGKTFGPLRKSPLWDGLFFEPGGLHWGADGVLVGFQPGGNLDVRSVIDAFDLTKSALSRFRETFCEASPGSAEEFASFLQGFDAAVNIIDEVRA